MKKKNILHALLLKNVLITQQKLFVTFFFRENCLLLGYLLSWYEL